MNIVRLMVIILLAGGAHLSAQAAVTASLDRDRVDAGEGVQLLLEREGSGNAGADLSPLARDFSVVGTSSGSSVQIINGHFSSKAQLRISLMPKHDGKLEIPSLQWDGQSSPPLTLTVGGNSAAGASAQTAQSGSSSIFFDTKVEPRQASVDEAVLLTVSLYTDAPLQQASLDLASNDAVKVQQIGADQQSEAVRDGRSYQVISRRYVLFPQRSGQISLDGPVLNAQVVEAGSGNPFANDPFFGSMFARLPLAGMMNTLRPLRLQGKTIVLNVQPRPAGIAVKDWVPASELALDDSWRPDAASVHAGEPLTRHLHLQAQGITAGQLPDLSASMPLPDGIKAYPDPAKLDTQVGADGLTAKRDQDIALIAARPGHYELPAMRLSWWDTKQRMSREVVLPARTLDVLAAAQGSGAPPAPIATTTKNAPTSPQLSPHRVDQQADPWRWVSLVLATLLLGSWAVWWRERRRANRGPAASSPSRPVADKPVKASPALKTFLQAAEANNPQAARRQLLAWAAAKWPQHAPTGLQALSQRLRRPELAALLQALDRACFTEADWQGAPLAQALQAWRDPVKRKDASSEIADLYA